MASLLNSLAALTVLACLIALLFHGRKLVLKNCCFCDLKHSSRKVGEILQTIDQVIQSNIMLTQLTLKSGQRESEELYPKDQEEFYEHIKSRIYSLLQECDLCELGKCMGNLDQWIHQRIEFYAVTKKPGG